MKKPKSLITAVNEYTIKGPIGEGGCGIVYEAQDESGSPVAIKILLNISELKWRPDHDSNMGPPD